MDGVSRLRLNCLLRHHLIHCHGCTRYLHHGLFHSKYLCLFLGNHLCPHRPDQKRSASDKHYGHRYPDNCKSRYHCQKNIPDEQSDTHRKPEQIGNHAAHTAYSRHVFLSLKLRLLNDDFSEGKYHQLRILKQSLSYWYTDNCYTEQKPQKSIQQKIPPASKYKPYYITQCTHFSFLLISICFPEIL